MADIVRRIDRLRLRAQHHVVHHRLHAGRPWPAPRMRLNTPGLHHLALGEVDVRWCADNRRRRTAFPSRAVRGCDRSAASCAFSSASAAATLASTMNSSISFMDSSRSRKAMDATLPSAPSTMRRSGRSRSSGSRACRARSASDLIGSPQIGASAFCATSRSSPHRACRRRRAAPAHRSAAPPSA